MTTPRFLQIHTLHSYPAALLNRDDSGLAKRMPFGGAIRTRVSSQCLKRHWRDPKDEMLHEYALHRIPNVVAGVRSRNVVGREVIQPIRDGGGVDEDVLEALEDAFTIGVYGDKAKLGENEQAKATRQPLLLGLPEVEFLRKKAEAFCKEYPNDAKAAATAIKTFFDDNKSNFKAMREQISVDLPKGLHGGLESALFGRMVTSDPGANIDAAIHVAHAFTVHQEESESDYFSVVDDLQRDYEDPGAAHIGDVELTAGIFYGYVVVDVPGLVSNLTGCESADWQNAERELAAKVVEHLVHLIATVSPGAKLGSTAPYGRAKFMLIEAGSSQPYSLADAFRKPVPAQIGDACNALVSEIKGQDDCYGVKGIRRFLSTSDCDVPNAERLHCDDLATWAAAAVRNAKAA